ncbi:hypothetical protein [Kitasatospora sp. MAP5-34]|uniref:hypothetical protein n=1 Tax=Kitasatospora sp. MAP5-34 TaxID=3035102 RepID=UPI00247406FB|nr:hypothetical protein [Kitasatospora sp. MAP5-34]MDH6580774.1 hypothetical protein [Kitasatospora sp. MAP5-34]
MDTTYDHLGPDGQPTTERTFYVTHIGRALAAYEHHSQTLGVAFGWRRGLSPNGRIEGLGSYTTPDFAGWHEITAAGPDAGGEPSDWIG